MGLATCDSPIHGAFPPRPAIHGGPSGGVRSPANSPFPRHRSCRIMSPGFPGHGEGASVPSAGEIYAYLGIFAALLAAGVGFPIPEEIPIVTAGVLAGRTPEVNVADLGHAVSFLGWSPATGFPAGLPWAALGRDW